MKENIGLTTESTPRPGRYPVKTAIRFRIRGEDEWHQGITEDISRTGVFLRSSFLPDMGAKVEMVLSLPAEVRGRSAAEVFGQGRIVRQTQALSVDQQPGVAATIDRYRLARKGPAPQE
ncbi:MAG: PilZ domain-containing protein [Terriglobia bacterium]